MDGKDTKVNKRQEEIERKKEKKNRDRVWGENI